jgi:uncharacterized integral membrane protein
MKSYIKAIGLIIILLFLVTFGIKNNQLIKLEYYFNYQTPQFPLYLLAYACATIGVFIGMLIGLINRFHQRKKIKILTKLNNELKAKSEKEKQEEEKPTDQKPAEDGSEKEPSESSPKNGSSPKDKDQKPEDKDSAEIKDDTKPIAATKPA